MAKAKQTVIKTKATKIKTNKKASKTKSTKRGNPKRCQTCGRFM